MLVEPGLNASLLLRLLLLLLEGLSFLLRLLLLQVQLLLPLSNHTPEGICH
jgi:hypothetical protein